MGRVSTGVRGMQLDDDGDEVVGMICGNKESNETVMVVSEKGYGKRTNIVEKDENGNIVLDENGQPNDIYRITNRGGKGVKTINITEKTGKLVAIKNVNDDNDLMIINKSGVTLRTNVSSLSVIGRAAQGVKLIDLGKRNDEIASVCKVATVAEDEIETITEEGIKPEATSEVQETNE
jgi:DNA gyrase subunit A